MTLNDRAHELCEQIVRDAQQLRVSVETLDCGTRISDCGVAAPGGLEAGRRLAEICMAGLGSVSLSNLESDPIHGPGVEVRTDHAKLACMASQYAGWEVKGEGYFAMGSGPMRAAAAREPLFDDIAYRETAAACVGVLETSKTPPAAVCEGIALKCGVAASGLTLLIARTRSLAGTMQIVARTVETAMHKLFELEFDLSQIESGVGTAPLPPVAADQLSGIGRTNDAILYGAEVTLWLEADDEELAELVEKIPSHASRDFGVPFAEIFQRYDGDFYKIDPHLFSPAKVCLMNLSSGRSFTSGETRDDLLAKSFTS